MSQNYEFTSEEMVIILDCLGEAADEYWSTPKYREKVVAIIDKIYEVQAKKKQEETKQL